MSSLLLKASLAAGTTLGVFASGSVLRAEERSGGPHERRALLSVYDPPSTRSTIAPVAAPPLLREVAQAREHVQHVTRAARAVAQDNIARFITFESSLEQSALSIASPEEKLNPGALYVGVATLSASILARNRGLFVRTLAPPTFLILSLSYFLPLTAARLASIGANVEDQYFPQLAAQHGRLNEQLSKMAKDVSLTAERSMAPAVQIVRRYLGEEEGGRN